MRLATKCPGSACVSSTARAVVASAGGARRPDDVGGGQQEAVAADEVDVGDVVALLRGLDLHLHRAAVERASGGARHLERERRRVADARRDGVDEHGGHGEHRRAEQRLAGDRAAHARQRALGAARACARAPRGRRWRRRSRSSRAAAVRTRSPAARRACRPAATRGRGRSPRAPRSRRRPRREKRGSTTARSSACGPSTHASEEGEPAEPERHREQVDARRRNPEPRLDPGARVVAERPGARRGRARRRAAGRRARARGAAGTARPRRAGRARRSSASRIASAWPKRVDRREVEQRPAEHVGQRAGGGVRALQQRAAASVLASSVADPGPEQAARPRLRAPPARGRARGTSRRARAPARRTRASGRRRRAPRRRGSTSGACATTAADGAPTLNEKPPETGCESDETTRQATT